jgi:RHS repeat-associated protein
MVVLAGNGDGGGAGAGSGKDGKGKKGAGTGKDEKDPNGDGKNGKCGGSGPSKCSKHESAAAGDPVEVSSGRVYTPIFVDVAWPGPLPFSFRRKYSSNLHQRDVGLGFGWTHSMAWDLQVRGKKVTVWDESGTEIHFKVPAGGFDERGSDGSIISRDGPDLVIQNAGLFRRFEPADTTGKRFRMKSFSDSRKNTIELTYDSSGRVAQVTDCVGRVLRIRRNAEGRIAALEAPTKTMGLITFAQYRYDDKGDLVSFTNAEGHTARFAYVGEHLLAANAQPGCVTYHYRYDAERRCVETWGCHDNGALPALSSDAPKLLADGRTRAKGMLHARIEFYPDGYREVIDSMAVRRFFVGGSGAGKVDRVVSSGGTVSERFYDQAGNLVRLVDDLGNTSFWTYDENGNVIGETDPSGNTTTYLRDEFGREIEIADSMGTIAKIKHDQWNNATEITLSLGDTAFIRHDSRGLPIEIIRPDGTRILQEWDVHGNKIRGVQPDGSVFQWTYDELGNQTSETDPTGAVTHTRHNLLRQPIEHTNANGRVVRYDYSPAGELIYMGDGKHALRADYDGHLLLRQTFGDGSTRQYGYNREHFMTEIVNEAGDVYRIKPSDEGFPLEVVSFDGRKERYKYDPSNRLIEYENGLGQKSLYTRDAMGQITSVEYADGTSDTFEYDLRGKLVRASNEAVQLDYRRNAAGLMLREDQIVGEERHYVERTYDIVRERVATTTSLGHAVAVRRDLVQEIASLTLDDDASVQFQRDARGFERQRVLPGGAVIATEYDVTGMITKRAVYSPNARPYVGPQEPEWIGPQDPAATVLKAFRLDHFDLVGRFDRGRGATSYENDARGRIVSATRENQLLESFRHDATNNVYETNQRRAYDKGNLLVEKGEARYVWDEDGQLIEKRLPDGVGGERVYRYEWSARQSLSRVITPDGTQVEFDYDPFARRVAKRVYKESPDGEIKLVSKTRFVWDGPVVVHEIREIAREEGDPIIEERTYAWADDRSWDPLGHRDVAKGDTGRTKGNWVFYVNDYLDTPEQLVTGDGRVVGELERSVYGKTQASGDVTTAIRFPGQWQDEETGLFYNRYRYYDPDMGRYISQDPNGLMPDPNLYRYTTNPLHSVDPDGLHDADWQWTPPKGSKTPPKSGSEDSKFDKEAKQNIPSSSRKKFPGEPGKQMLSAFNKDRTSDTEAKITRDRLGDLPKKDQGGHLNINGELPPCKKCHKKMKEWADKNNTKVTYNWPKPGNKNTVTYEPNKPPSGNTAKARKSAARPTDD